MVSSDQVGRYGYRLLFASVILLAVLFLVVANAGILDTSSNGDRLATARGGDSPEVGSEYAEPRENITVVTSEASGYILATNPNGSVLYFNDTRYFYYDVDPSPEGETTVVYSALDVLDVDSSVCDSTGRRSSTLLTGCTRQVIERVNLTTGETTVLYSRVYPQREGAEWHDVDRIDGSTFLVADMYDDEVYVVDTETGIVEWAWEAQNLLSIRSGGPYPDDWTHMNDVEQLADGRVMVSLRNQDQVVFINKSTGAVENWTLGSDGDHGVLYEQHNPDYIPEENGGPAVVVADSENNRVIEYQRTEAGEWEQTWVWGNPSSSLTEWPRDADRLPNGHTLVTDTHNNRLVQVDEDGEIVWSMEAASPYEAERLGTGDESRNGPSATSADLSSRDGSRAGTGADDSASRGGIVRGLVPRRITHAISYTTTLLGYPWIGVSDVLAVVAIVGTGLVWGGVELHRSGFTIRSPVTRSK